MSGTYSYRVQAAATDTKSTPVRPRLKATNCIRYCHRQLGFEENPAYPLTLGGTVAPALSKLTRRLPDILHRFLALFVIFLPPLHSGIPGRFAPVRRFVFRARGIGTQDATKLRSPMGLLDGASVEEHWITMESFQETTGIDPIDCLITRTYCHQCHAEFKKGA